MQTNDPVNDYIDQCIDAAIVLKKHFPEQKERNFWMPFKTLYPKRQRITEKMCNDIISVLSARKIDYKRPEIADGFIITINLVKNALTVKQATSALKED
ncbi:hypothetical protein OIM71_03930 [Escherichia coli]|nr:hypothetical protein [Escherichia coli]WNT48720.1 hypothetical protein SPLA5c_PHROGS00228 [Salmonella phage SPLA5c]